ncbi:MAG TPA: transcription termination factor NusA, partial [Verrucomicrobiae bacterium]|nr:transcription termination factor NusA [Verrucomicrobiae bacterium]
ILPVKEQAPREVYRQGDRLKALIADIRMTPKGPQIVLSRSDARMIAKLFEAEVPEISEGIVEVKGVVREAGSRSKIAVYSHDSDVDPVGACVGMRGSRVQNVVSELRGEKIDIIPFSEDIVRFACNSLSPAVVTKVYLDEEEKAMEVVVADDQLSLAIGKKGQNVRLAAKLTGWKLDIKSESRAAEAELEQYASYDGTAEEAVEEEPQAEEQAPQAEEGAEA